MTAIDEIKARLNIVDLVSETVKLRRSGKNYTGFCPFHGNSRTPAFAVFPDSGTWRCFGECNEGGDIFKYYMKKEGWDFPETLRYLADRAGVVLEPLTPERQMADEAHERLHALMEEAVTFYRHQLTQTPGGADALAYVQKRGLTPQTIEAFGLGYAPDRWDAALQYLTGKGYTPAEMLECGMVTERQGGGGVYDRFRNRIMFPIRDAAGKMAGFGARILNPNDVPKFLNSPQTVLFDKGRLLYGLDAARKAIRTQDQVIIVEGYLDVIALHQGGFPNTVSPMGTALTEDQLKLLKRYTRRIVLALDADAAGEKATLRGLEVARQSLDREDELVFDARGLLRHEARLQADVRVTTLPPGMDPDEVVLRDPAEWQQILESARPVVIHVMETLAAHADVDDPKVKTEIAAQIFPLIEDVPSPIERDAYRQRLARLLKVDERALLESVPAPARPGRRPNFRQPPARQKPGPTIADSAKLIHSLEAHVLQMLLRQPESLYLIDRTLQTAGLSRFSADDFEQMDHQLLARNILDSLAQEDVEPLAYITDNVPQSLQSMYNDLVAPLKMGEPNEEKRNEDLIDSLLRLRNARLKENINQLRYLQEEVQQQGEMRFDAYQKLITEYSLVIQRLNKARKQPAQLDE
jgi:DNA primase